MESTQLTTEKTEQQKIDEVYEYARYQFLNNRKDPGTVRQELIEQGFDEQSAYNVVETVWDSLNNEIKAVKNKAAQKDMLVGGLWCVGGTVLTIAHIGFIFWGAIVFGAVQFFRGVSNYSS